MYRLIILLVLTITLSSCSTMKECFVSEAKFKDISNVSKQIFINDHSLTQKEYEQWYITMSKKADELSKNLNAQPPKWQEKNHLYLKNSLLFKISIPESKVPSIKSVWEAEKEQYFNMFIFANNGIFAIHYDKNYRSKSTCNFANFESLSYNNMFREFGDIGKDLYLTSKDYLNKKKEQEITKAKRVFQEKLKKAVAKKRSQITSEIQSLLTSKNKTPNTLVIRKIYLNMPATDCALLLNHYLDLPTENSPEYYEFDKNKNSIIIVPLIKRDDIDKSEKVLNNIILEMLGVSQLPAHDTKDGKLIKLCLTKKMVDIIFNASSLSPEEFARAVVNNYSLVKTLSLSKIEGTYIYAWRYSDAKHGFRITISKSKELILEKIATNSDLTFKNQGVNMDIKKLSNYLEPWMKHESWASTHPLDKKRFHKAVYLVIKNSKTPVSYIDYNKAIKLLANKLHPNKYEQTNLEKIIDEIALNAEIITTYQNDIKN